jgi:uncharacterized protein YxeA
MKKVLVVIMSIVVMLSFSLGALQAEEKGKGKETAAEASGYGKAKSAEASEEGKTKAAEKSGH